MAYFPNGDSGLCYQQDYCSRCVHDEHQDCPVWALHLVFNYDALKDDERGRALKTCLNDLIPQDGLFAGRCKMFVESRNASAVRDLFAVPDTETA